MSDSTSPEPALQTAARFLAEGRPAEAAERLAALVGEAPTYAAAHVLRATALEAAGFVDEAIVSWGRAAALVPRSPLVHRERERLLASRVVDEGASELPPAVPAHVEPTVLAPQAPDPGAEVQQSPPREAPRQPPAEEGRASTPSQEEPAASPPDPPEVADELDALISQLEDAPRIRPDPTYSGPTVSLDTPDVDDLASETLAKIYAAQHQYVEAAIIYEKLAARQPEEADDLLRRAAELRQRG